MHKSWLHSSKWLRFEQIESYSVLLRKQNELKKNKASVISDNLTISIIIIISLWPMQKSKNKSYRWDTFPRAHFREWSNIQWTFTAANVPECSIKSELLAREISRRIYEDRNTRNSAKASCEFIRQNRLFQNKSNSVLFINNHKCRTLPPNCKYGVSTNLRLVLRSPQHGGSV